MNELKRIVADIESVFEGSSYPRDFLEAYDQMECLASHTGRETFLVQRKADGGTAVATCFDRSVFPFRLDIDLLKGLEHPGLPRYYEQFQNERMLCVVREYIEGEPLNVYAGSRQLSVTDIVRMVQQLCDILQVLHTHVPPVIHRDIKPENIIVRPDGGVVLIDFDISRTVKQSADADTVFFGTRGYAPPEQYGFGQTDSRTDIYALGVLLRWLVTGSARENGNVSIDANLQAVIDRCTAFSPEARFDDVAQVRQALASTGKPRRRLSPLTVVAATLAAALLIAAGFCVGRFTGWLRPTERVVFQEPLIEQAARLWLGKPKGALTSEELSQVKQLYIYGTQAYANPNDYYSQSVDRSEKGPIRTLDDLALLPNLEELHIVHQGYVDVSGAAGMARLYTVELKHMHISGVAPLAESGLLKHVILFCAGISDVTALENCPWLETLDVGLNDITSLSQIGAHPNVRNLGLMWLKLDDVNDVAQRLPKVRAVTLQHGAIRDPSGLRALRDLQEVYVLAEQADEAEALFGGTDVRVNVTEN